MQSSFRWLNVKPINLLLIDQNLAFSYFTVLCFLYLLCIQGALPNKLSKLKRILSFYSCHINVLCNEETCGKFSITMYLFRFFFTFKKIYKTTFCIAKYNGHNRSCKMIGYNENTKENKFIHFSNLQTNAYSEYSETIKNALWYFIHSNI